MADTSIDTLTLDIVVKNDNATRRINSITKAIEKLNTAVSKSGNLDKLTDTLNSVSPTSSSGGGRKSSGGSSKTSKTSGNLNIFSTLGKWNYYINMARYYGKALANTVQYAMDYVETQNLWQVANRQNLKDAEAFIQKMNKAYGISEQTLMNYQAIFKNMLSALGGINDEISSGLSMQLTQMAVDFSSLYNVAIPDAMTKFQAILSGQVRPIRSVSGYDITENTIFDIYQKAGGDKSMRQLSQLEKRLLRIVAVFDQMDETGALGDMEKTIESASNQARIMTEQVKETLTWVGQLILMWLNNAQVLQKVNAFLMTTKEIVKSLAVSMGYEEGNFLNGLVTSSEEASEAIDDIQGKLLSFDKFESLNSNDSNVLGIDQTVLNLLDKINVGMTEFKMQSSSLSEEWLKLLGYTYNEENGIWEAGEAFSSLEKIIPKVTELLGTLNKAFEKVGKQVFELIVDNLDRLSSMLIEGLDIVIPFLNDIIPDLAEISTSILYLMSKMNLFSENTLNPLIKLLLELIVGILKPIINLLNPIIKIISHISSVIGTALTNAIRTVMSILTPFIYLLETILKVLESIVQVVGDLLSLDFKNIGKNLKNIWGDWASPDFTRSMAGDIKGYATGGFPEDGFFYANSGELVGQFSNGRTAVANNEQIVKGITQGVYSAMMAYNAQTGGQNRNGDIYIDGTKVGKVVAKSSHKEMVRTGLVSVNA